MEVEMRMQALVSRVKANPKISLREIEQEVRDLMVAGVRCRRFKDEVGLSTYVIYKIRKVCGIARPPRPRAKLREIKVIESPESVAPATFEITIKIAKEKGGLKIMGERAQVSALLKGIL